MNKAQMRVAIAKDVIKQITAKRLLARKNIYLMAGHTGSQDDAWRTKLYKQNASTQLNEVLPKVCQVCAIGAVFVAAVEKNDALKVGQLYTEDGVRFVTSGTMKKYLRRWFSAAQLYLMEGVFEGWDDSADTLEGDSTDVLVFIMKNIIKNKGTFKP